MQRPSVRSRVSSAHFVVTSLLVAHAGCGGDDDAGRSDAMPSGDAMVADAAGPGPDAALDDTANYVFVTAMAFTGDLGGIDGADAICNDAAQFAALAGTYRAWLSTGTVDAIDRIADARGWVRPDGLPFADRPSDIAAGKVYYPPVVTEAETFPPVREVWTSTTADGRFNRSTGDCDGWSSDDGELTGGNGTSVGGPVAFTDNRGAVASCDTPRSLLCLGIDHRAAVRPLGVGRIAFATSGTIFGSVGLENLDDRCMTEAGEANLEGTFLAMVAVTGTLAGERFDTAGPTWVRPDGVRLYATAEEIGGVILAPIAVTADGETYLDVDVWTGAQDYFQEVGPNCEDWTLSTTTAAVGRSGLTETYEAYAGAAPCTERRHLYCLQE
jgi:hypothetical protein